MKTADQVLFPMDDDSRFAYRFDAIGHPFQDRAIGKKNHRPVPQNAKSSAIDIVGIGWRIC